LPAGFDLTGAWASASTTRGGEHGADFATSVSVARGLTARVLAFSEVVRAAPSEQKAVWSVNGGVAMLLTPDSQLDAQVGRSVHNGSGWTLSAGVVMRRR
jgi:hypothetical protein